MLAVIAAMLFIGIVTAAMLKNTKSQAAASGGYGNMHIMSSTVRSGMIATETYFGKRREYGDDVLLELITDMKKAKETNNNNSPKRKPFIFENNSGRKTRLGTSGDQYFRSQLLDVIEKPGTDDTSYALFEIQSGRKPNGKALKKARAFYEMTVRITHSQDAGANNAIYSKGPIGHANAGMEVYGPATFDDDVTFQNEPSIFHGQAYFGGKAIFSGGSTPTKFKDKTYFADNVHLSEGGIFDSSVGIEKNIESPNNKSVYVGGDIWINGDLGIDECLKWNQDKTNCEQRTSNNASDIKLYGNYTNTIHRTNKFSSNTTLCSTEDKSDVAPYYCNDYCTIHKKCGWGHLKSEDNNIKNFMIMDDQGDTEIDILNENNLKMTYHGECGLNLGDSTKTTPEEKGIYSVNGCRPPKDGGGLISLSFINNCFDEASNEPSQLYDGHVVIRLDGDSLYGSKSFTFDGVGDFNSKVIFIVEGNKTLLTGSYFNTTPTSSTMIYINDNAWVNALRIQGAFHGLINIDAGNNPAQNTSNAQQDANKIAMGNTDTIIGAVHNHSERSLLWNSGDGGAPVVKFDKKALNKFAKLSNCGEDGEYTTEYVDQSDRRIRLRPLGYYFY